jgi:uncharacterized protein YdeI (YjbR/CyaY-like superfamily)
MKWSAPHFMYQGMLCGMQAFKEHCAFGFWKGSLIEGLGARGEDAMGHFGRITSIQDLPPQKTLIGLVTQAAALNEQGVKVERTARRKKAVEPPEDLVSALRKNKKALAAFQAFSPSHRREYVEWIGEAKRDDTRQRRLATAIEWLSEGKPRNWKYGRTAE